MINKEDIQNIGLFEDAIHRAINEVEGQHPDFTNQSYLIVALDSVFKIRRSIIDMSCVDIQGISQEYIDSVYSKTIENSSEEEIKVYKKMMIKISDYELIDLNVRRCLENHGIKYIGDLCVLTPWSLVNLKGFESIYLPMLRKCLVGNGLDFCTNFKCWPTIRKQMESKNAG